MDSNIMIQDQIRSVTQSCPTLCNPINRSMPGLTVHHHIIGGKRHKDKKIQSRKMIKSGVDGGSRRGVK